MPLKHIKWVQDELEILWKAAIISLNVSHWLSPIAIVPNKAKSGTKPQKYLCLDCHPLNSLLPLVLKAHSKAQGVVSLMPLPKIDKMNAILNGSIVYCSLDCTSGYHHITLSSKVLKISAFVTIIDRFELKKEPSSSRPLKFPTINKWST